MASYEFELGYKLYLRIIQLQDYLEQGALILTRLWYCILSYNQYKFDSLGI